MTKSTQDEHPAVRPPARRRWARQRWPGPGGTSAEDAHGALGGDFLVEILAEVI